MPNSTLYSNSILFAAMCILGSKPIGIKMPVAQHCVPCWTLRVVTCCATHILMPIGLDRSMHIIANRIGFAVQYRIRHSSNLHFLHEYAARFEIRSAQYMD